MKVTKVVLTPLIYQLHYRRLLAYTMFPAWEHASFNPVTITPHSTVTITPCSTPQTPPRPVCRHLSFSSSDYPSPDNTPEYVQTAQMKRKKIFQWYPWMMNTGLQKKYLKELFVSMNIDYHIIYANTHALMRAITLFHTWIVWI